MIFTMNRFVHFVVDMKGLDSLIAFDNDPLLNEVTEEENFFEHSLE